MKNSQQDPPHLMDLVDSAQEMEHCQHTADAKQRLADSREAGEGFCSGKVRSLSVGPNVP